MVVEDDNVALQCAELLRRAQAGRVTFMPLNTIRPQQVRAVRAVLGVRGLGSSEVGGLSLGRTRVAYLSCLLKSAALERSFTVK